MVMALNKTIPPREWEHKSTLTNINDLTVAHCLAYRGIIPPK